MAEHTTTSSISKIINQNTLIAKEEKTEPTMSTKYSAKTNVHSNENIPLCNTIQTNLHRLIQNKLKRKKKPTISQDSLDDTSIKKRKTKVEPTVSCKIVPELNSPTAKEKRVLSKPPLPPKCEKVLAMQALQAPKQQQKRKMEDNSATVQKLNAVAETLRLEVMELKTALASEKSAVRTLRAQNEAETRKFKAELKKLQSTLDANKKVTSAIVLKKYKEDNAVVKDPGGEIGKLIQEISTLKEANKNLEEKIQIANEAERRKTSDIREQKDSYEIRLTQITKSAKTEINRLLEEIKTKERNIEQLKKEIKTFKSATNKKDIKNAQHPSEMRKLKEIERTNNTNSSNKKCITTTCDDNKFNLMSHEITERILEAHDDLHIFRNKDTINSDTDSALSSAPSSISPQPPSSDIETPDIWQSVKNYSKELSNLQRDNESLQRENQSLKNELELAKQQIEDLEKQGLEAQNNQKMQQLIDRVNYLEEKEYMLEEESHELREQNELLEFRIIELEESNDKWSLRSNSIPDTRDMWTDTEKEAEGLLMYADRSDSGITSPRYQHHLEERNLTSPYDLSILDSMNNEKLRQRVSAMSNRPNIDEDDKLCLLQILSLLNNLEALSQDSMIVGDDFMNDTIKSKTSEPNSGLPKSFLTEASSAIKSKGNRVVATVLPYSSTLSSSFESPKKLRIWNCNSLQESGVFEGDNCEYSSQCTQTDPDEFPCQEGVSAGDLCAEIQKLNKFREKIEECVTKSTSKKPGLLSPNLSEQRRLQYYKDRLNLLEGKVLVYESSGDQQTKILAERLQREIQLESLVKDLKQRVDSLEEENQRLEEERCELEEAENDTRLRLQRLEIDLEVLTQRSLELEMSKEAAQTKLKECRLQCSDLQNTANILQNQVKSLEVKERDLTCNMNLIKISMPAILLFNTFMVGGSYNSDTQGSNSTNSPDSKVIARTNDLEGFKRCHCHDEANGAREKLQDLMCRERELTQNIAELNRAYNETLESADNLWANMERDYKDRLMKCSINEKLLKAKIAKLEARLFADSQSAIERVSLLEVNEQNYMNQVSKLNQENKNHQKNCETLQAEYNKLKREYCELKRNVQNITQQNLEREREKAEKLKDELAAAERKLRDVQDCYEDDTENLRKQLNTAIKELADLEVTNSELKEEVSTLESSINCLLDQRKCDEDKIKCLSDEIKCLGKSQSGQKRMGDPVQSLAQELDVAKRINLDDIRDLNKCVERLGEAMQNVEPFDRFSKFYV